MFSFDAFRIWRIAGFAMTALPYSGGWFAQPNWLIEDLETLMLLNRLNELPEK